MQGAYIPPVLKESLPTSSRDNSVNGYQSFGSTDHMGRRNPSSSSTQHSRAGSEASPDKSIDVEIHDHGTEFSNDSAHHPLLDIK